MKEGILELITYLEKATRGIIEVTNAVHENILRVTNIGFDGLEGAENIRYSLEKLTEGQFLSVESINEALKKLKGVKVEIPEDEISRLNSLFPSKISTKILDKIGVLKSQTARKQAPLIMQLPEKVMLDGQIRLFNIEFMEELMQKVSNTNKNMKPIWLTGCDLSEDVKRKVWDGSLTCWTSECLTESKAKTYNEQLEHQAKILGEEYKTDVNIILAMSLGYISGKQILVQKAMMRLNTLGVHNTPLLVYFSKDGLEVEDSDKDADSNSGIGASFQINDWTK